MYECISQQDRERIERILSGFTLREKIGQIFCMKVGKMDAGQVAEVVETHALGGIFYAYRHVDETAEITATVNRRAATPVIATADLVNGPGSRLEGATLFPWQMAVGAADSEELAEKMGIATAREGRAAGVHWTLGPIVDLSLNMLNCMMHTRTFGADPDHVLRLGRAFIKGVQQEGLMAATAKHFPGDGTDDRDTHICTLINDLPEAEWMESYGRIWQGVIDAGVMAVMSGFIALPWLDPRDHYAGPLPAALSGTIQVNLLRERLGFQGVLISDAIPMIGFAAMAMTHERVPLTVAAGTDMVLWAEPERHVADMERALDAGMLTEERLDEAVRRILALKLRLGLLNDRPVQLPEPDTKTHQKWADEIGERSITVIRNADASMPVKLKPGAKVLTVSISFHGDTRGFVKGLDVVDEELRRRGFEVTHLDNPGPDALRAALDEHDAVFMNVHVMPRYGSTRFFAGSVQALWDAVWVDHPNVVFTSFGDPYKLYEMPYVPNYINTYSNTPSSQRAVVKVWLGELEAQGHIPVDCPGFFERNT